jgi:hypothetical protein
MVRAKTSVEKPNLFIRAPFFAVASGAFERHGDVWLVECAALSEPDEKRLLP